ncbi:transporter substrate-binding domain-containing protein [Sneathiella marina]|uniref:Transporter substrate-binding domain-containing protein n=1 Tax=Sneathiella marina TaxID=2950108 RepID=A0ABY4W0E0_9PROT|nr:transporter substrate-binding domain-containing protein [Sneathiella marina]USG60314.1 transporter substrate-binding domain-containing protein [Sneathiella marina]
MALLIGVALSLALPNWAAADNSKLRICLEDGSPPYSYKFGKRMGGFELLLAERIAQKLDKELYVQWYESEDDDEVVPIYEVNALLSANFCDFVGGLALIESNLRTPVQPSAALPDYEGMKRSDRGTRVNLGELTSTIPFIHAGLTVVLSPKNSGITVKRLSDLKELSVGAEVTTLSSAILIRYQNGLLADHSKHFKPGEIFPNLEAEEVDAVLVERHRFDRYKQRNPETKLSLTEYLHSISYNIGFAALKNGGAPISEVNEVILEFLKNGEMEKIAAMSKMSYMAPRKPAVFGHVSPAMLTKD